MKTIFLSALCMLFLASCVVDEADLSRYAQSAIQNVEEARDIDVVYTDSSYKIFVLKAPLTRRYYTRTAVREEFPEGIEVTFFNRSGQETSWLTADFAIRDQANKIITVQKNVVMRNDAGERLDGPELIWDERKKEIYTDRFVRITRSDGSIVYSYGFKSNDRFTRYELNAVSGDMNMESLEASKQDSTSKKNIPATESDPVMPGKRRINEPQRD